MTSGIKIKQLFDVAVNSGPLRTMELKLFFTIKSIMGNYMWTPPAASWRGVAWRGVGWRGVGWRGAACGGVAWRGVAWPGAEQRAQDKDRVGAGCSSPADLGIQHYMETLCPDCCASVLELAPP